MKQGREAGPLFWGTVSSPLCGSVSWMPLHLKDCIVWRVSGSSLARAQCSLDIFNDCLSYSVDCHWALVVAQTQCSFCLHFSPYWGWSEGQSLTTYSRYWQNSLPGVLWTIRRLWIRLQIISARATVPKWFSVLCEHCISFLPFTYDMHVVMSRRFLSTLYCVRQTEQCICPLVPCS